MTAPLPKILVVDDDKVQLAWFEGVLKRHFKVLMATDVDSAIAVLDKETFIMAVLCDICLPGENDGFHVLELVGQMLGVPVVLVTGSSDKNKAIRALRAGAFDYLEKPCDPQEIIETLTRAVELGREGPKLGS